MGIVLGRDYEVKALQKCMKSDRSELVLVCGRRRVGKTYLIEQYFGKKYAFSFVGGHNAPPEIQLRNFKKALIQYGKFTVAPEINNWYDAFDALELILTKGRNLWVRTILSTVVGEGFDSIIFITISFLGTMETSVVLQMILFQYLFKVCYEVLFTPLTYLIVGFVKKKEEIDTYDYDVKYNVLGGK